MRDNPKVSVLLSLYQPDPAYLKQQLASIEAQDYLNIEVLIWDDYSGEDFEQEISAELQKTPFVYQQCENNLGYVKAFEYLTDLAKGEYLAFCDQDDLWEPGKISRYVAELIRQDAILATSDRVIIDENNSVVIPSYREYSKDPKERWCSGDDISCQAVFTCYALGMTIVAESRAVKSMLPFTMNTGHDKWVTMCAAAMGRVIYIEEPLQRYRRHGSNVSGAFNRLSSKQEYYEWRVDTAFALVGELLEKFPGHPRKERIMAFAKARKRRKVFQLLKLREIAPQVVDFEICLKFIPAWVFKIFLKIFQGR